VNDAAPTKDTMVAIAETLREAGVSGKNFVKCIAPTTAAMKSVWEPRIGFGESPSRFSAKTGKRKKRPRLRRSQDREASKYPRQHLTTKRGRGKRATA
jgi:hypothetical protein